MYFKRFIKNDKQAYFPVEKDRYHLYMHLGDPWAWSAYSVLHLKGIEELISVSCCAAQQEITEEGQRTHVFDENEKNPLGINNMDPVNGCRTVAEIYQLAESNFQGIYTLPILFDKKTNKIINNDSADIIKMFNFEFNGYSTNPEMNLFLDKNKTEIESASKGWIYNDINQGVYKIGLAVT